MIEDVKIVELDKSWKERVFVYRYTTSFYYDLELMDKADGNFCFCLTRKAFERPVEKQFEGSLLSDWLFEPVAYGAFDGKTLLGVMCISVEDWNNRLRVAELWVDEPFRHQGVGKKLMVKLSITRVQKTCGVLCWRRKAVTNPQSVSINPVVYALSGLMPPTIQMMTFSSAKFA